MNLRLTPRALAEAKRINSWWSRNRPAAPELFESELAAVLDLLREMPGLGSVFANRKQVEIRRVLMPRTRNHVYYAVAQDEVVVLSVWGAPRGRGPKL